MISERLLLSSHQNAEIFLLNLKENVVLDYNFPWFGPIKSVNGVDWYLNTLSWHWTQKQISPYYSIGGIVVQDLWDAGEFKRTDLISISNIPNLTKSMTAIFYTDFLVLKLINATIGQVHGNRTTTANYFKKELNIDISCIKSFKEEIDVNSLCKTIEPLTKDEVVDIIVMSSKVPNKNKSFKDINFAMTAEYDIPSDGPLVVFEDDDPLDSLPDTPNLAQAAVPTTMGQIMINPYNTPVYYTIPGGNTTTG